MGEEFNNRKKPPKYLKEVSEYDNKPKYIKKPLDCNLPNYIKKGIDKDSVKPIYIKKKNGINFNIVPRFKKKNMSSENPYYSVYSYNDVPSPKMLNTKALALTIGVVLVLGIALASCAQDENEDQNNYNGGGGGSVYYHSSGGIISGDKNSSTWENGSSSSIDSDSSGHSWFSGGSSG